MSLFENNVLSWLDTNGLFGGANRVLLAVSGGADSVAMAYVLANLKQQGRLSCDYVIGHVNHCLRGADSDADEAFVRDLADSLTIPAVTKVVDVKAYAQEHKLSIETAGRVIRLKTLAAMADEFECDCIATAHHKDDLAETLIHRLMRGTGFRGLCGIWPVSHVYGGRFVRPMLAVRQTEIVQYCQGNSIQWREDASNRNVNFTRNKIRLQLLPVLQAESSNAIVDQLAALTQVAQRYLVQSEKQARDILDEAISDHQPERVILHQARLNDCPPWVFYEVIRKVLVMLDVGLRNYTQEHFETIRALIDEKQGNVSMPGQIQVYIESGMLIFDSGAGPSKLPTEAVQLEMGKTIRFGLREISSKLLSVDEVDIKQFFQTKNAYVEWFDADKLVGPVEIRCRRDGDRFWPIGAKSAKKVGRFLIDAGLHEKVKKQAFVIADAEKILWLAPVRMSEQVKITPQTRHILEIRISELK